jgi:hypothetical protein
MKKQFGGLGWEEKRLEQFVVFPYSIALWFTIGHFQLCDNELDAHCGVSSCEGWVIGDLEAVINVLIKHPE